MKDHKSIFKLTQLTPSDNKWLTIKDQTIYEQKYTRKNYCKNSTHKFYDDINYPEWFIFRKYAKVFYFAVF